MIKAHGNAATLVTPAVRSSGGKTSSFPEHEIEVEVEVMTHPSDHTGDKQRTNRASTSMRGIGAN
jgi:hypothetical protein